MKDNKSNPLVSYGVLLLLIVIGLIPYLGMSAAYGTLNPERWSTHNASSAIMILVTLCVVGFLFYGVRERGVDLEVFIGKIIDIEELQHKKYLDYVLAHYGNVASVAAFVAVSVFAIKNNLKVIGVSLSSLFLALMICIVFLLYGFVFIKTVFGAKNRRGIVWFSLMPMLFLDLTLMTMAIKSVPAG